ncbi:MAG: hypothetical protein EOP83_00490 [Verrucomicrobiaceae bacterium]|nr:MAG: hypothetical protein EOP83_00490 [Verrucomicrobiaceae bacterium]
MTPPCRFEKMIRIYRAGRINEAEFTLKFLTHAVYDPASLANASLELTEGELTQIIACAKDHTDQQSFRGISGSFIVDHNEIGVWEEKEREIRPLFNRIVEWLEEQLERKQEGYDAQPLQFSPYRPEFLMPGSSGAKKTVRALMTVLTRLKDLGHVEFFKECYDHAPMVEAVTYVCTRDYPVVLYGYYYSTTFRITTAMTRDLQEGDWTIGFGWNPVHECFGFSIWEGTPRGVVALPSRVCERSDFGDAIDELIGQMAAAEHSQLWMGEAKQGAGGK